MHLVALCGCQFRTPGEAHQISDATLHLEDRATSGLGGVGGDHGHHGRICQRRSHLLVGQTRGRQLGICGGETRVLRRIAGAHVDGAATLAMNVFGEVGEQGEMAERPDDRDRVLDVDVAEELFEFGAVDFVAADPERLDTRFLDQFEGRFACMFAHDLPEDPAEQPDVLAEWFGELAVGTAGFRTGHVGALVSHRSSISGRSVLAHLGHGPCRPKLREFDVQTDAEDEDQPDDADEHGEAVEISLHNTGAGQT